MGANNLTDVQPGSDPQPSDLNQYKIALVGDLLPRRADGMVGASAADVGQQAIPFRRGYFDELFVDGVPVGTAGAGGGTAIMNGVLKGRSPNNRDGYPGWMNQAGAQGITLQADADNPLEVKLDGVTYQLTAPVTGGLPLPGNLSIDLDANDSDTPIEFRKCWPCGGGAFDIGDESGYRSGLTLDQNIARMEAAEVLPITEGDTLCIKATIGGQDEYVLASRWKKIEVRTSNPNPGRYAFQAQGVLATRGIVNTSPNDYATRWGGQVAAQRQWGQVIRVGYVFVDPTVAQWEPAIERRIVGSTHYDLSPDGDNTGDMLFREQNHRWYRWSGSAWVETSRVFLGLAIIEGGAVVGTVPVRGEEALAQLEAFTRDLGLGMVSIQTDDSIILAPWSDAVNATEHKPPNFLLSQAHENYGGLDEILKSDLDPQGEDTLFVFYRDCNTGQLIVEEDLMPQWLFRGTATGNTAMLVHPNKHAIFLQMVFWDQSENRYLSSVGYGDTGGQFTLFRSWVTSFGTHTQRDHEGFGLVGDDVEDYMGDLDPQIEDNDVPSSANVDSYLVNSEFLGEVMLRFATLPPTYQPDT